MNYLMTCKEENLEFTVNGFKRSNPFR